jgi:glutamate 5-kinase
VLLASGAIPILNENDAVSDYAERYGDNDRLAARIAGMVACDTLIIFSDIDGLYTDNPRNNPQAEFIYNVPVVTPEIQSMASGVGSNVGSGGMATKLLAAIIARSAGCNMMIADGTVLSPITHICNSGRYTFFPAGAGAKAARKHWILGTPEPAGSVVIDDGAVRALLGGSSLLPIGCRSVTGQFKRGDCISIFDKKNTEIARGLVGYNSEEVFMILGRKTQDIPKLLGYIRKEELIHRNDLVLC